MNNKLKSLLPSDRLRVQGVSMLLVVLIIGAVCLSLTVGSLWLGAGSQELTQVWRGRESAALMAESCLENSLWRLKNETFYAGELLSLGDKSCIITISRSGSPMTAAQVDVLGTYKDYNQRLSVEVEVNDDDFKIIAWREN